MMKCGQQWDIKPVLVYFIKDTIKQLLDSQNGKATIFTSQEPEDFFSSKMRLLRTQ